MALMIASGDMPGPQQRQSFGAVTHVDNRLRRDDADAGLAPEHAVPDREDPRLHGAANLPRRRIKAENRERRDRIRLRHLGEASDAAKNNRRTQQNP